MYFKPAAHAFAREWLDMILEDDNYWDQNAFNDLFRRGGARAVYRRPPASRQRAAPVTPRLRNRPSRRAPKEEGGRFGWRNHESNDGSFMAYGGHLRMGILPTSLFANGHTYYVQRMFEKHGVHPYVVHNTFQYSGTEGKRHR